MSFDYGASPVEAGGGSFKRAEVGKHAARLRSVIHLGMFEEEFKGKKKAPAPQVVAVFELKEEGDFDEDGTTPLTISKDFALRKGDKSFLTKITKALDPDGTATGFDDLIGRCCEVEIVGSKQKNEDGTPKYVNFGGISSLHPKLAAITEELQVEGAGHCRFEQLTKEAVLELHPIIEVADILMQGLNYAGSSAESAIAEIRTENEDFGTRKAASDDSNKPEAASERPASTPPAALADDEEF